MPIISIEGNIGGGKSTQIELLKHDFNIRKEPIDKWPLKEFYEDPSRWAFLLQIVVLRTLKPPENGEIYVCERCPLSTRDVFWKNLYETNQITDLEYNVYNEEHRERGWEPELIIYIHTPAEVCFKHIQHREQEGDFGVTLEYLKKLENHYLEGIKKWKNVHVVNGDQTIEKVHKDIRLIIDKYVNTTL